jgi:SPP1 gp7 family putative phage head morphogenesis protein
MSRLEDLRNLEEKRKRKVKLLLLGILLSADSEQELIPKIKKSSRELLEEIKDIRKASYAIADKYSENIHRADDKKRQLLLVAAALYMISSLARRISISDKETYLSKAKQAVTDSEPIIERLVNTEIYESNHIKFVANHKGEDVMFMWNAINDRKTCSVCSSLDGNFYKLADVPDYPHPNCRCIAEITSSG